VQTSQEAADAVLSAFQAARQAGLPPVECYRAGVAAWKQMFPDQAAEYAAKQAVSLILAATTDLTIRE
jgi:hypothetical protein